MKRNILLTPILILALTIAGCGGGGGSTSSSTGTITGTVTLAGASSTSLTTVSASSVASAKFAKVPLRRTGATAQSVSNERIIKFKPGTNAAEAAQIIASMGGKIKKKIYGTDTTYVMTVNENTFSKFSATQNANVEYVEKNLKVHAFATPSDTYYASPYYWNYNMMNMEQAWDVQKGSTSIIVAVIDTGVAPNHPDLAGNLITGYDIIDSDSTPWDTTYYDLDNQYSHGTHVTGIISAVTNNSLGIAGIAWNVKIMPIRVLDSNGEGDFADIAAGINKAVEMGANIINLSFGAFGVSPTDTDAATTVEAIDNAIASGVTVIAAAGNEGETDPTVCFPANYDPVIAVGALDETGALASYSCYGSEIDICAPGGGEPTTSTQSECAQKMILSTSYDKQNSENCFVWMIGTSMASPHIAGLAALLYSRGITNPSDVTSIIKNTATSMGNTSLYGAGKADAYAALSGSRSVTKVFYYNLADTSSHSSFYSTSTSGTYSIPNLTPGSYKVCAFIDNDGDGAISKGDMYAISDAITVTAKNTTTVNLSLKTKTDDSTISITSYFKSLL